MERTLSTPPPPSEGPPARRWPFRTSAAGEVPPPLLPRALAWTLLGGGLFLAGLLRQFNEWIPRAPWPGGHAVSLLTVLLALVVWLLVRAHRATPPGQAPAAYLYTVPVLALLVLLVGEKWASLGVVEPSLRWIPDRIDDRYLADATYRFLSSLGLLLVALASLLFLPFVRQRLRRLLSLRAFLLTLAVLLPSLVVLFVGLHLFLRAGGVPAILATPTPSFVVGVITLAQVGRAVSEEFFYRGLLQEGLIHVLPGLGITTSRRAKMMAIFLVSALFTLEHFNPYSSLRENLGVSAFVFCLSVLFGVILVLSRSLYLTIGFHFVINTFIQRGGLLFLNPNFDARIDPTGHPAIFDPRILITLHAVLLFLGLYIASYRRRRVRRTA